MANVTTEEGLDPEGKAILDDLEKEGFEIAGRTPAVVVDPPQPAPKVEPVAPKVDAPAPKVDPPAPKDGEPPVVDNPPAPDRKIQHVPLPKYLEAEKALKEANKKIAQLTKDGAQPTEVAIKDATSAVKELVEKFGYEEDDAKKMVDVFKHLIPGQTVSPEMQRALDALPVLDKMKAELEEKQETAAFNDDFSATIVKEFPQLEKYKDQIKEMAYSDTFAKTPLRAVALEFMHTEGISPTGKDVTTVDKAGGGTNRTDAGGEIDFANITDEQFSNLTPEQADQFFAYQDAKERAARGALNR